MKWPWKRRAELCEPRIRANSKLMELETAKEILAEIFLIQPADVEEMIQSRLEERSLPEEENIWPEERGEKLWPATFCLGD
ncbi:MAG: hypothetical protein ACYDHX_04580 [Methanothrix sp.]